MLAQICPCLSLTGNQPFRLVHEREHDEREEADQTSDAAEAQHPERSHGQHRTDDPPSGDAN